AAAGPLEWGGRLGAVGGPGPRRAGGERDPASGARPIAVLSQGAERDRDSGSLRGNSLRQQGGAARGEPLSDGGLSRRAAPRAGPEGAVPGGYGDLLRSMRR